MRPKKQLGQHFLKDEKIASAIVRAFLDLLKEQTVATVLEVGPGTGALTKYLVKNEQHPLRVIEIDREAVALLSKSFPQLDIVQADFLDVKLEDIVSGKFAVIGNFPYNISSQILFRVLEHRDRVPVVVGMFQKEVAERIAAPPGSKTYGILSVLMQAFYKVEFLLSVDENAFTPPPKVKSAVISFVRNEVRQLQCDEKLFFKVVKTAFNQRRKTLRNALSQMIPASADLPFMKQRAEQLSCADFEMLTLKIQDS